MHPWQINKNFPGLHEGSPNFGYFGRDSKTSDFLSLSLPLQIQTDAVFSGAKLPDGNTAAFGSSNYLSPSYNPNFPSLQLKIDVVFGGVTIQEY